jgi:Domain of unknown function (DUF2017)
MSILRGPITREGPDRYRLRIGARERQALGDLVTEMRELLRTESASSDPAMARLFPPAHPDDLFANLEWERTHGDPLLAERLSALDTLERTVELDELTEDDIEAWLRSINAIRLVLGTRLEVTEETTETDYADDPSAAATFDLYGYLSWLESWAIEALSGDDA